MAEALQTRLTQLPGLPAPRQGRVASHNFRRMGEEVLISNDWGFNAFLSRRDYRRYLQGGLSQEEPLGKELLQKGFLAEGLDFPGLARRFGERRLLDWKGPNVHTVVVTLRCNFKCLYCHASVVGPERSEMDMTLETARRTVDLIFQSPSPTLMIEFQGGEPLLNWPVVRFIVEYARRKNKHHQRALHFGLISNFSLLDESKIDFLVSNGVSFCTSLDGPAELHNKNRVYLGGNSHDQVVSALKGLVERRRAGTKMDLPNAICTVTRHSLPYHREIVDQLVGLGIERVQFGPLDPIGFARRSWESIGYDSRQFVEFYAKALDYIIELNQKGVKVYEKMALILLIRLLEGGHWRFPNADGVARLAYNHDGSIYTCEEGRLLANEGEPFFRIGHVSSSSLAGLLDHPTVRAGLLAASPENQPLCFQCAYSPYCTVLPVYNYQTQAGMWGLMPANGWCEKMMGIFDVIFERLRQPAARKILESWLEHKSR